MNQRSVLWPGVVQQQPLDALVSAEEQRGGWHTADGRRCQAIVDAAKAARLPEAALTLQPCLDRVDGKQNDVYDQAGNSARL